MKINRISRKNCNDFSNKDVRQFSSISKPLRRLEATEIIKNQILQRKALQLNCFGNQFQVRRLENLRKNSFYGKMTFKLTLILKKHITSECKGLVAEAKAYDYSKFPCLFT